MYSWRDDRIDGKSFWTSYILSNKTISGVYGKNIKSDEKITSINKHIDSFIEKRRRPKNAGSKNGSRWS